MDRGAKNRRAWAVGAPLKINFKNFFKKIKMEKNGNEFLCTGPHKYSFTKNGKKFCFQKLESKTPSKNWKGFYHNKH